MKTAEQWAEDIARASDNRGGFDSEQDFIPHIEQIQQDAIASTRRGTWEKAIKPVRFALNGLTKGSLTYQATECTLKRLEQACDEDYK